MTPLRRASPLVLRGFINNECTQYKVLVGNAFTRDLDYKDSENVLMFYSRYRIYGPWWDRQKIDHISNMTIYQILL